MTVARLAVCAIGGARPTAEVFEALATSSVRAVVVPHVRRPTGQLDSGRGPRMGPFTVTRVGRRGRLPGGDGDWPIAPVIAVPDDLLTAAGGPDPRFSTAIGWADLIERLRHLDPDLAVVDAEVAVDHSTPEATSLAADAHIHASNRPGLAWRLAARLVRPAKPIRPPSVERQLRRLGPGG